MSRRRRRAERREAESRRAPQAPPARAPRRRRLVVLTLGFVAVGLGLGIWALARRSRPTEAFPPPHRTTPTSSISLEDFVGADRRCGCHRDQYDAWRTSTHGRAGGSPRDVQLIVAFDGRPIRFRDAVVIPHVTSDGRHEFVVTRGSTPPEHFPVVGVIGGGHMVGGGTQGFLTEHADGTLRFLPFDYSATERLWFCNTGGRAGLGWLPITADLALADCGDWPPSRVLGALDRFANCQQCHGSQIDVRFDTTAHRYATRFTSLAVNCESCHGPGRRHVDAMRAGRVNGEDTGMRPLAVLDKDLSIEVCLPCHTLKQDLAPGFLPGMPFREHFSAFLPAFGDAPLFPDGRTRTFAYQEGHLASACYRDGSMTCTDCHDPHAQTYRDHTGQPLVGRFDDGQCLSCHPSKGGPDLPAHTRHAAGSPGSRCVACHMPYLQQPTVGNAIRYARSDHTIPVPRPAFDAGLGLVSACRACHADRSTDVLESESRTLYGDVPPHAPEVRGLLSALATHEPARAAELVLGTGGSHAMAQFSGLAHYFIRYLELDMPALAPGVEDRLEQLGLSPDADVAGLALAALHYARGSDRAVHAYLTARLRDLGEREGAVRARWTAALLRRGAAYRATGDPARAARVFQKALEVAPDHARAHAELGAALSDAGAYDSALVHFRRSLSLDPVQPLVLVNVAYARMQRGDLQGGLLTYQEAATLSPDDAFVYTSWGNALLRMRRTGEAATAFERARELEPGLAAAHFGLGAAYAQQGRREEAMSALRKGLEIAPSDKGARALLDRLGR